MCKWFKIKHNNKLFFASLIKGGYIFHRSLLLMSRPSPFLTSDRQTFEWIVPELEWADLIFLVWHIITTLTSLHCVLNSPHSPRRHTTTTVKHFVLLPNRVKHLFRITKPSKSLSWIVIKVPIVWIYVISACCFWSQTKLFKMKPAWCMEIGRPLVSQHPLVPVLGDLNPAKSADFPDETHFN